LFLVTKDSNFGNLTSNAAILSLIVSVHCFSSRMAQHNVTGGN